MSEEEFNQEAGLHGTVIDGADLRLPEEVPPSEELRELLKNIGTLTPEELVQKGAEIVKKVARAEEESQTDAVTGLLNYKGFRERATLLEALFVREWQDAEREIPTAILSIDLKGFKDVINTGGRTCADCCLQLVADKVGAILRKLDIFARVGRDKFNLFLSECTEEDAIGVARKVRSVIEEDVAKRLRMEFPGYEGELSASIGIAALQNRDAVDERGIDQRMRYADYAAYVVKASGKGGEFTLALAREGDPEGKLEQDFLAGKPLSR
jgi:diguanylate cyclase (GGDEF)-like protein